MLFLSQSSPLFTLSTVKLSTKNNKTMEFNSGSVQLHSTVWFHWLQWVCAAALTLIPLATVALCSYINAMSFHWLQWVRPAALTPYQFNWLQWVCPAALTPCQFHWLQWVWPAALTLCQLQLVAVGLSRCYASWYERKIQLPATSHSTLCGVRKLIKVHCENQTKYNNV